MGWDGTAAKLWKWSKRIAAIIRRNLQLGPIRQIETWANSTNRNLGEFNKSQLGRIQQIATLGQFSNLGEFNKSKLGRIQQIATWANSTNRNLGEFNKFHDFFSIVEFGHQGD
jgi:hypothetical protein